MSETLSPTTRETWQAHKHEENVVINGAEEKNGGTFLYPNKLQTFSGKEKVVPALQQTVSREQDSAMHTKATEALRRSQHWNALAGHQEADDSITNDAHVREYLKARGDEVMKDDAELREVYSGITEMFTQGVHTGIEQGYIPDYVDKRLQAAVEQTAIEVTDPAFFEGGHDAEAAHYDTHDDHMRIRAGQTIDRGLVIFHELDHKLSGGTFVTDATTGEPMRTRAGFSENKGIQHVGLTEAINHHLSLGIQTGNFETLDPDKREDGDRIYYGYRKILSDMIDKSQGVMQLKTETRASYEDTTEADATLADRRAMVTESMNAYGLGAFRKFDVLCRAADNIPNDENFATHLQALMDRIQPPVLDAAGNVTEKGTIDIEGLEA